jgi:hypothetical protein
MMSVTPYQKLDAKILSSYVVEVMLDENSIIASQFIFWLLNSLMIRNLPQEMNK